MIRKVLMLFLITFSVVSCTSENKDAPMQEITINTEDGTVIENQCLRGSLSQTSRLL